MLMFINEPWFFPNFKDGTEIKCYVAECLDQVIGVSVLRQEEVSIGKEKYVALFLCFVYLLLCLVMSLRCFNLSRQYPLLV